MMLRFCAGCDLPRPSHTNNTHQHTMPINPMNRAKEWLGKYRDNLLVNRLIAVLGIDILVKLSGIILLPVYLRLMSQEEYGLYGYLLSIIITFSVVLNFGLYIPVSKFYHDFDNDHDRGKLLFTISCLLTGILIFLVFPIYFFKIDYLLVGFLFKNQINYPNYRGTVLLALLVTICNFMLTNFFFTSEKIGALRRYNMMRIIFINAISLLGLFIFRNQDKVRVRLEATYLVELGLFAGFAYFQIARLSSQFSKKLAVASLKLALPVMLSAIFGIVINFGDKFFLEKYGSFKDMAYYYLAVSCASVIPLIFTSFQNAWLPLFLKEKDLGRNVAKTNKVLSRLFLIFAAISVCIILFVKVLLVLGIIQIKYQQTLYILPILLVSQIVSSLVPLYSNYMVYFEKTHIVSIVGLLICLVSLSLSFLLIPRFKVYGAAAVSLASNSAYLFVYYLVVKAYTHKHLQKMQVANESIR